MSVNAGETASITSGIPRAPEDHDVFRWAQLLLLMQAATADHRTIRTIDRLCYYDFFAANPYVVVSKSEAKTDRDRLNLERDRVRLKLAGFFENQLSYASTGQRFVSRRKRMQSDTSQLVSLGLVTLTSQGYSLSPAGQTMAASLNSVYAESYRQGAQIVMARLNGMSDPALERAAQRWLGRSWLLIDLLQDVSPEAATVSNRGTES